MGFLLVQHELLRAKAKVNSLTYDQSRFQAKKERITKAIGKKEEFYNKKQTALENYYKNAKTTLTNALNSGNWAAAGSMVGVPSGISTAISGLYSTYSAQSSTALGADHIPTGVKTNPGDETVPEQYRSAETYPYVQEVYNADGTKTYKGLKETDITSLRINESQMMQQQINQLKTYYQSIMDQYLDSLKEAAQNALEEEKDLAMLPLNEEDTEMDAKIKTNETLLESAKSYEQSLEKELPERVKDSAPKFGLG